MRLRNADRGARSSDLRSNAVSWIPEVKHAPNVSVRKKRGRRAPPSAKTLSGKKVDKVIDSDDAVDNNINDTDEGQEHVDGRAGISSDGPSSASEQDHSTNSKDSPQNASSRTSKRVSERLKRSKQDAMPLKQEAGVTESNGPNALANKDGSVVNKVIDADKDDVSDPQVNTTSSDDKGSEEVEDVKVCDICGDVGEEEKLAVCSRCNDGAEHIYCMRVMMDEVPDRDWLCEDCQKEVDFGKEKKLECQENVGASKKQSFEGQLNKPAIAGKSRSSSDNELEAKNAGSKELDAANEGNDMVSNMMEEDAAITSSGKVTIPETGGSYMGADSRKRMPPPRESSLGCDADKGKQPGHQVAMSSTSNAPKNQAPQPRGQYSRSTSFNNSKVPKVKQLLNEVPQKPRSLRESWSSLLKKEGPISMTTKSATFKRPKPCEPAIKGKSSILSPEEPRVNQNVVNDICNSISGNPSATTSMVAPVLSKTETMAQPLVTGSDMVNSDNLGQGGKSSLGNGELKKPLLAKAPGSMMLSSGERGFGTLGSGVQRKVIQNSDSSQSDKKVKDLPGSRPGAPSSNRTVRCQRCNEAGHLTQFCAIDKHRLSAMKPFSERNLKDSFSKRNRTAESSVLATTENAASRADQSEQILKCGTYQNPIYGPKDILAASFNHVKKPSPLVTRANEQDIRYSLSTPSSAASEDCSKLKFKDDHPSVSATTGISADSDPTRAESCQGFSTGDGPIASTVPELDYIWQGGFELRRNGRLPELCDGLQAHLSCSASQLVLDVAKKFPAKVQLEEVPRQDSWPKQFQESGPTYDNVGLFFFARDVQSYENHYSKLVENMLKNDLVLRGSVGTVELLIFPSNVLSKNFQKWNRFCFLWGVFRVCRKDSSNLPPDLPTRSRLESNLIDGARAVDPSSSVLTSNHPFSKDVNSFAEPGLILLKSTTSADYRSIPSLEANHHGCLNGETSLNQPVCGRPLDDHHDSVAARCSTNNSGSIHQSTTSERKNHKPDYSEHQDNMCVSSDGNISERNFDVNTVPVASVSGHTEEPGKERTTINLNDAEDLMDIDYVNTVEVNTGAMDTFSHANAPDSGARKRNFEMANGADEINGALEHKKIKLDTIVPAHTSLSENIYDGRLSSKVHPVAASSVDDGTDNKAMAESSNREAKCVFPLDLNAVDDTVSENVVNILSSDDEVLPEPIPSKVGTMQDKGGNLSTDSTGSLSLSCIPVREGTS